MKKVIALLLVLCMLASALVGCAGSPGEKPRRRRIPRIRHSRTISLLHRKNLPPKNR